MSYTFGAAATDDIAFTLPISLGGDNRACLVLGWWYPTTLTAGRGYWGAGSIFGAEVDATTSEIRLRTDNATTDGEWVTSGAGIVVDQWHFLAFLSATENTTVAGDWRVWVATGSTAPRIMTPAVSVARNGNYTASNAFTVGNKGTTSAAFQGDIGWVSVLNMASADSVGSRGFPRIAASGVITDAEAEDVGRRWVYPIYCGRPNPQENSWGTTTDPIAVTHLPLDALQAPGAASSQSLSPNDVEMTVSGATWTHHQPPIRLGRRWWQTGYIGSGGR
jgi:hypothetical protein